MAGAITLDRIVAAQAAYVRCIDSNELESWPDFFTDQCLYKVTTAENHKQGFEAGIIYADTKGMLVDRIVSLRQANIYEKQSYRHILGLPTILKNGGGEAECETPFMVARIMHDGQTDLFATGRYLDTCRLAGNHIKFARKIVVCDSSRIDTLLAIPL
ncbi:MAG TPA: aromatic-ring-hydroxylating dioxygenase subunit beta [Xanthobacteraceae bacterium]|nr:aromatic-ring-hydroxylating dioxygenase subunit beta [Xanthobacteraceae bacterium]